MISSYIIPFYRENNELIVLVPQKQVIFYRKLGELDIINKLLQHKPCGIEDKDHPYHCIYDELNVKKKFWQITIAKLESFLKKGQFTSISIDDPLIKFRLNNSFLCRGGKIDFFGGGVKKDETSVTAAIRELEEEAGLKIQEEQLHLLGEPVIDGDFKAFYYLLDLDTTKSEYLKQIDEHNYMIKSKENAMRAHNIHDGTAFYDFHCPKKHDIEIHRIHKIRLPQLNEYYTQQSSKVIELDLTYELKIGIDFIIDSCFSNNLKYKAKLPAFKNALMKICEEKIHSDPATTHENAIQQLISKFQAKEHLTINSLYSFFQSPPKNSNDDTHFSQNNKLRP